MPHPFDPTAIPFDPTRHRRFSPRHLAAVRARLEVGYYDTAGILEHVIRQMLTEIDREDPLLGAGPAD